MKKPVLSRMRPTKAQISLRSLISAFLVRYLDCIIPILSISKVPRLSLACVAEQAGLSLTWSHTSRERFSHDWTHMVMPKFRGLLQLSKEEYSTKRIHNGSSVQIENSE